MFPEAAFPLVPASEGTLRPYATSGATARAARCERGCFPFLHILSAATFLLAVFFIVPELLPGDVHRPQALAPPAAPSRTALPEPHPAAHATRAAIPRQLDAWNHRLWTSIREAYTSLGNLGCLVSPPGGTTALIYSECAAWLYAPAEGGPAGEGAAPAATPRWDRAMPGVQPPVAGGNASSLLRAGSGAGRAGEEAGASARRLLRTRTEEGAPDEGIAFRRHGHSKATWWRSCEDPVWRESIACQTEGPIWWDRLLLTRAFDTSNFHQLAPFLEKLYRGEAVTVVAIGSSITMRGGSFHQSEEYLRSRVARVSMPSLYQHGWLQDIMAAINASFPHPQHLLVNLGRAAHGMQMFADMLCLEQYLPSSVDLVLNENLFESASVGAIEHLMARITAHLDAQTPPDRRPVQRPAYILIETYNRWVVDMDAYEIMVERNIFPPPDAKALCPGNTSIHRVTVDEFHQWAGKSPLNGENMAQSVAAYQGFSILSLRNFFWSLFADDFPLQVLNKTECEMINWMFADRCHPTGIMGRRLMSDLVLSFMGDAEFHLRHTGRWSPGSDKYRTAVAGWRGALIRGDDRAGGPAPRRPGGGLVQPVLNPYQSDFRVLATRCYGMSQEVALDIGVMQTEQERDAAARGAQNALQIVENNGWQFTLTNIHGTVKKRKPGWYATEPGSELRLEVDTAFDMHGEGIPEKATIFLTYLQSYEHMGQARVTCVAGCECEPTTIDARGSEQYSLMKDAPVREVTRHPKCIVALTVLSDTTSGEHKFKISMIAATLGLG